MSEIPTWWLVLSGVFFFLNAVLFVALAYAATQLVKFLKDVSPRVAALEKSTQELIVKVQGVAEKVDEVATSVKQTVENVGGRARGVVGSAEIVASVATKQFEKYSPIVTGVLTAVKVIRAVRGLKVARDERKSRSSDKKSKGKSVAVYKG
jgi:hypothetical protein